MTVRSRVRQMAAILTTIGISLGMAASLAVAPVGAETAGGAGAARTKMAHIDLGGEFSCAQFVTNAVRCWGRNDSGQLGYGDVQSRGDSAGEIAALPDINLGVGRTARAISAGYEHACALLDNGSVKCWGKNLYGQLGVGSDDNRGDGPTEMGLLPAVSLGTNRTATAISAGIGDETPTTCAILDGGSVKCWGDNSTGQLGIGSEVAAKGTATADMGEALPAVNLGDGLTASAIAVGGEHVCVIVGAGQVKCWGSNAYGQLGYDDVLSRGMSPSHMGGNLQSVNLGSGRTAVAISAGYLHTCALLDNGSAKCWGDNSSGELGTGDGIDYGGLPGGSPTEGETRSMTQNPGVVAPAGRTFVAISSGYAGNCAVLDNGTMSCWGDGISGRFADANSTPHFVSVPSTPFPLGAGLTATAVAVGDDHSCATANDGTVRCWGSRDSGRLGDGSIGAGGSTTPSVPPAPVPFMAGGSPLLVEGDLPTTANAFVPLTPVRILDTRSGLGAATGPVAANGEIVLTVAGRGGVPATGASAVVINVTAVNALSTGYVTVYPADVPAPPNVSNINLTDVGQTVANLVTVRLSPDGKLRLFTTGRTHLLADVAGYYEPKSTAAAGRFVPVNPTRVFDTRSTSGLAKLASNGRFSFTLRGRSPIPSTGVGAVVLNVTVADTSGAGYISVWPTAPGAPPTVSNINVVRAGQNIANQVIVPLSANGQIDVFSSTGAHIIADVAGYFTDSTAQTSTSGLFTPVTPGRLMDTRGAIKLGSASKSMAVTLNGKGNLPAGGMSAVAMNVTATATGSTSYITVWPTDLVQPVVSTLNWTSANATVPNHAIARVSATGSMSFATETTTHLIADSAGWYS
jgi:alpha-tubulin suppressor-like RCC1 family protein